MKISHCCVAQKFLSILIMATLCPAALLHAQPKQKIQIVLVGTVHLTPSTVDVYKNKKIDLSSKEKQKEIAEVVNKLAAFKPDKICLEYPMEDQLEMDSIYSAYLKGIYKLADNERDLFGFQTVKKLGLLTPTCINYSMGLFNADTVNNFAMKNDQEEMLEKLKIEAGRFINELDSNLSGMSLREFLIYCNSREALQANLGMYAKYFAAIGKENNYVGAGLVADWYSTNIHIYANVLRIIKPGDRRIIVIFGQGHIPVLKHLLANNADFEVIEVEHILK